MSQEQMTSSGTLPDDFVGAEEHGPVPSESEAGAEARARRRSITSIAWGGVAREISTEHGAPCSWCGQTWPVSVGMPANRHPGLDISMQRGTRLFAAAAGKVEFAGWSPRFYRPNQVQIRTPSGELHIYAHMWTVAVAAGANVAKGAPLGTSGEQTRPGTMDPDGTGAHLHFEARRTDNRRALDPEPILSVGGNGSGPFGVGDRIKVIDPPLRFRTGPGLSAEIIEELPLGTVLTVTGGPQNANGYAWYQARKVEDNREGWLAGQFCAKVTS